MDVAQLTLAEVDRRRNTPGESLLLFITDRCPVGCAHCSVDSRRTSPMIRDFELFESIVDQIAAQQSLSMVGISGGEPFVERRGLTYAVEHLVAAGKKVVLYTSGIWARGDAPEWIRDTVRSVDCIFLSTDAFHAASVDDERFVKAARLVAEEGTWLIVQVLDLPDMVARAENLLDRAFGQDRERVVELSLIPPLPYGRGAQIFHLSQLRAGSELGVCNSLASPVVRYDGNVISCCNERVIMGHGPARLRASCDEAHPLSTVLTSIRTDPLLRIMGEMGTDTLTHHPKFADLAEHKYANICELCWEAQKREAPLHEQPDRLLAAIASLAEGR